MPPTETDVRRSPQNEPLDRGTHLVVALECLRPTAGSLRVRLDDLAELRIGRGAARQVVTGGAQLTVPDPRMSSRHARLVREPAGGRGGVSFRLEDSGSKNGTLVNGAPAGRGIKLADGDLIRLGQTLFLFRAGWPTERGSPEVLETSTGVSSLSTLVPPLARRFEELARIATADVPVLLLGETGTGKEVMADAIHTLSRRSGDQVTVNCGALPRHLVESVLFGHKRGAFSGAVADSPGFFRAAEGGTLFLDEVGDLPLDVQVVLLRALQEGEITPVGAPRPVKIDVRVLAATNRDLEALVRAGTFREDLYSRLAGFTLRLPPLRERLPDLGILVGALLQRIAPSRSVALTSAAGEALFAYGWPRNIRELEKCLTRACALAVDGPIDVPHLELPAGEKRSSRPLTEDERRAQVIESLTMHRGNILRVADSLKTSRSQVHRWLKRFALVADDFKSG